MKNKNEKYDIEVSAALCKQIFDPILDKVQFCLFEIGVLYRALFCLLTLIKNLFAVVKRERFLTTLPGLYTFDNLERVRRYK